MLELRGGALRAGFQLFSGQVGHPGPGGGSQELPGATAFTEGRVRVVGSELQLT